MTQGTFTFRVDEHLKGEFTQLAKAQDRSGAQLLRTFMRDYIESQKAIQEHDRWFRDQVHVGLAAAEAGELLSAEEVEAEAAAWRVKVRGHLADAGQ